MPRKFFVSLFEIHLRRHEPNRLYDTFLPVKGPQLRSHLQILPTSMIGGALKFYQLRPKIFSCFTDLSLEFTKNYALCIQGLDQSDSLFSIPKCNSRTLKDYGYKFEIAMLLVSDMHHLTAFTNKPPITMCMCRCPSLIGVEKYQMLGSLFSTLHMDESKRLDQGRNLAKAQHQKRGFARQVYE